MMRIKKKNRLLLIFLFFQISSINIITGIAQNPQKNINDSQVELPVIYIDLSPIFQEMGYTENNIMNISEELFNKVLLDYCKENPFGYTTEKPEDFDSNKFIKINEFSFNEYNRVIKESSFSEEISKDSILLSETKACVTCAVWDYPGDEADLGWYMQHAAEDHLYEHAEDDGGYDLVFTNLENSDATRDGLDTVLEYFFENYDNVDLYFLGHGAYAWIWINYPIYGFYCYYYCPYDSIDADTGDVILDNVFWEGQLKSTNPLWDSSPMRMVMFASCHDWEFRQEALYPGGSTSHDRAFCGFDDVAYTDYIYYFMLKWCDLWYQYSWDSSSAAADARSYAWGFSQIGANMSYADTGSYIYC